LAPEQREAVVELLEEFRESFAWLIHDLSDTSIKGVEFEVNFTDDKVIWSSRRRQSPAEYELLKAYCEERCGAKLICRLKLPEGIKHPNATPVVMPRKKDVERNWTETRICGDYRPHNEKTVLDKYPMPVADEMFDDLGQSDCFSTLDLRMGYHHIRIWEGDQYKLAFWGHDDLYMPLRLPFGPKNGPAVFQRLMDEVLRHLREVARAFIDDTIVHTKGFGAHLVALRAVLEQLRRYNIKVHPNKIRILFPEVAFLGHMVNPIGLKPQELKVAAIQRIPYPTSVTAMKQLLGIINYYRKFLRDCSQTTRPLNDLLKKGIEFPAEVDEACKGAIDKLLKGILCAAPLLVRPDPKRDYELHTDLECCGVRSHLAAEG
jgi:putative transposase